MNASKKKRHQAAGFEIGSAKDFLGLRNDEVALVEMKIALAEQVRRLRQKHHLTQLQLAQRMRSSQSRIARIEARDPSISMELLVRAALAAGGTKKEVARAITTSA